MSRIKAEHFVRLWLEAYEKHEQVGWLAQKMGVSDQTVYNMYRACRHQGIELPSLNRTFGGTIDVHKLNELVRKQLGS